ncbi:MAG: single-stranded DNA-binding protein [Saprospiraceae bacterium]
MAINCKIELTGFLGSDAKTVNHNGRSFVVLNIATTDTYPVKDEKSGETKWKEKETQWHDVLIFRSQAAHIARDLKKGDAVSISGTLAYKSIKDEKGYSKRLASIIGNFVEKLEFPRQEELTLEEAAEAVSRAAA